MRQPPTTLDDVHRTLGASLLALAERGELKAGDGSRLVAEAKERLAVVRLIEARKEFVNVMRRSALTVYGVGWMHGESHDSWEGIAQRELDRIIAAARAAGVLPSTKGSGSEATP